MADTRKRLPEMANPLKPTARTRKEMATPRVCEKPTTSSRVASIPKPAEKAKKSNERDTMQCKEQSAKA